MDINEISGQIVDAAMKIHSTLGAGLLERPYLVCLQDELAARGLGVLSEVEMPVCYNSLTIAIGYRLDMIVEDTVIVELKSLPTLTHIHRSQLLTYLRLSGKPLGLLLNFGERHLKDGIIRLINSSPRASR